MAKHLIESDLDKKADLVHSHVTSDITDLDLTHTHKADEVVFTDTETLQYKMDNGLLGGSGATFIGTLAGYGKHLKEFDKYMPCFSSEYYNEAKPTNYNGYLYCRSESKEYWKLFFTCSIEKLEAGMKLYKNGEKYYYDIVDPTIFDASNVKGYYISSSSGTNSNASWMVYSSLLTYFNKKEAVEVNDMNFNLKDRDSDEVVYCGISSIEGAITDFDDAKKFGLYKVVQTESRIKNSPISGSFTSILDVKIVNDIIYQTIKDSGGVEYSRSNTNNVWSGWISTLDLSSLKSYDLLPTEDAAYVKDTKYIYGDIRRYGIKSGVDADNILNNIVAFQKKLIIPKDFEFAMNYGVNLLDGCSVIGEDRDTSVVLINTSATLFGLNSNVDIKNITVKKGTSSTGTVVKPQSVTMELKNICIENVRISASNNPISFYNGNYVTSLSSVVVKDVEIEGISVATSSGVGIDIQHGEGITISNIKIRNIYYGIKLSTTGDYKDYYMDNLDIRNCNTGISQTSYTTTKVHSMYLTNSVFKNNKSYDISSFMDKMTIKNNTFEKQTESPTSSIYLTKSKEFYLESNTFVGYDIAIKTTNTSTVILNSNQFVNCTTTLSGDGTYIDILETVKQSSTSGELYPVLEVEGNKVFNSKYPYGHFYRYYTLKTPPSEIVNAIRFAYESVKLCYMPKGTWNINNLNVGYVKDLIGESKKETILKGFNATIVSNANIENITFDSIYETATARLGFNGTGVVDNLSFKNIDFINMQRPIFFDTSSGNSPACINGLVLDNVNFINNTSTINSSCDSIVAKGFIGDIKITNCNFIKQYSVMNMYDPNSSLTSNDVGCNMLIENCNLNECEQGLFRTSSSLFNRKEKHLFIKVYNNTLKNSKITDLELYSSVSDNGVTLLDIQNNVFIGLGTATSMKLSDKIGKTTIQGNTFISYNLGIDNYGVVTDINNTFIKCTTSFSKMSNVQGIGKQVVFVSDTEPTQAQIGDFWLDTSTSR